MNKRIKELNENRGAKLKEARAIIDKAVTEKRALTADESTKVDAIQGEADRIGSTIEAEVRQFAAEAQRAPKLTEGEQRDMARFDYGRLLRSMVSASKGNPSGIDGIEAEIIQEGEREAREAGIEPAGIVLPRSFVRRCHERRDMTATGQTSVAGDQGGMTVQTNVAGLLDDFFNASVIRQAGATVLEGLTGNLIVPRLVAGTAPAAKGENAAADEVSPTTAKVTLQPKRLPADIDVSEQLFKQSSSAIEAIIRAHLTNQMLAVQEAAFFHGSGTNEAYGIAGTSGIGSVAGGANGLAPAWSHIVGLETAVDINNALLGSLRYVSNGKVRGKLKQTSRVSGQNGFVLEGNAMNGYDFLATNAVSSTLTKGTSSGVCSAIFFGNFADYWVGYWGGVSLELVRDKTNAIGGLYTLVASAYYDGAVVRPKSFAAMLDALTT